jgi:adenylate cyclase
LSDQLQRFDASQVLREARDLQQKLRRFVPGPLAQALSEGREIPSGECEVSVLFVDIRGYSSLSESRAAADTFGTVNRYSEAVSRIVTAHGGTVVEFSGDGVMVVFGGMREVPDKERSAVASGLEIVAAMAQPPLVDERLSVGIGIATGLAFVGEVRSTERHFWSAIGNTTNLAARLQASTRELDAAIAVDSATRERARSLCAGFVEHPNVPIRGRREPQTIFTLPLAPLPGSMRA